MKRVYQTFEVKDINLIKQQMLSWCARFNICCFLDNRKYESRYHSFEGLAGVGAVRFLEPPVDFFPSTTSFTATTDDWIFGHFNYEAGLPVEREPSVENAEMGFPAFFLFVPEIVFILKESEMTIGTIGHDASSIFAALQEEVLRAEEPPPIQFTERISRQEYLDSIRQLKRHIQQGDCYEINFCQEFYATAAINPASVFNNLIKISPNPFSAFYRIHHNYLLCASPERFLKRTGDKIVSQPIKGTSARSSRVERDALSRKQLSESTKDKSENVMIVDLVRNDLSKICEEGTVVADELFGVYSFPHVHQMISTISGILKKNIRFGDILQATFPMGSMTGAPKKKVMELIKKYEHGKRGMYSGTVGYFTPEKDFDFNVVIRSLVYNAETKSLSFHVGSAITASSEPEKEYEECLLKGKAIVRLFSNISNEEKENQGRHAFKFFTSFL